LRFDNDLYTYGTGFSFQVGAIAKVTNEMRVGLAYESSTWYNLSDELSQKLVSVSSSSTGDDINDVSDPRLTNFTHRTSYKHQVNLQEVLPMFWSERLNKH
jgi:long-subunit fatty acid transport protein